MKTYKDQFSTGITERKEDESHLRLVHTLLKERRVTWKYAQELYENLTKK